MKKTLISAVVSSADTEEGHWIIIIIIISYYIFIHA